MSRSLAIPLPDGGASPSIGGTSVSGESIQLSTSNLLDGRPSAILGSTAPAISPTRTVRVQTESPEDSIDDEIHEMEAVHVRGIVDKDDLNFWPTILRWPAVTLLVVLYTSVAVAVGMLWWSADRFNQFHLSSENVHMIARYFPSITGTITVILSRQTIRESIRMVPYVNMADQYGRNNPGAIPWKSVSGAFFPWQYITITPTTGSIFSLGFQFMTSFVVSLKVALLATFHNPETCNWTLTVRVYPAIALMAVHALMAVYTLYLAFRFKNKSTGLKWDPVSIADYVALFAHCNALKCFAPLELNHDQSAKLVMAEQPNFRLGYWKKTSTKYPDGKEVYGIGIGFPSKPTPPPQPEPNSWLRSLICLFQSKFEKRELKELDECPRRKKSDTECTLGKYPFCEHYPYRHSPGCSRLWILLFTTISCGALGLSIFALVRQYPMRGFSLENTMSLPSNFTFGHDNTTDRLPAIDPNDPNSTLLVYALLFKSLPTYVAGLFTSTIIHWIDLNMRFFQPFKNMLGKPNNLPQLRHSSRYRESAEAADTILLSYLTLSALQVPLEAFDRGHYKVAWYSFLNSASPLFPILVGGLLTLAADGKMVDFQFSMTAFIGVLVFLVLFSFSIPCAFALPDRLLPRQFYSLADLMAMCYEANFLSEAHLDIADRRRTPSKEHMEARILSSGEKFLFGFYRGRDKRLHIGFDVADTRSEDFTDILHTGRVEWARPEKYNFFVSERIKTATFGGESGVWWRTPGALFRRKGKTKTHNETEMPDLTPSASATGSETRIEPAAPGRSRTLPSVTFAAELQGGG